MSRIEENNETDIMIRRYLSGEMSPEERYSFEKEMQKDPFLADAVEGLATITAEEAEKDLAALEDRIFHPGRRNRFIFYRIAAIALVLVGVSSILMLRQIRQPDLLSDNLDLSQDTMDYPEESFKAIKEKSWCFGSTNNFGRRERCST